MTMRDVRVPHATVVDPEKIAALPWQPLEGYEGVTYKLLWRSGKSVVGIMRIAPGHSMATHAHAHSRHHIWVLEGGGEMAGRHVSAGSYLHVPAGAQHGIGPAGPTGCTILYFYLRDDRPGGDTGRHSAAGDAAAGGSSGAAV